MSVEDYFDMIGRKTAALIAGSVQAGAMLATDDGRVIEAYRSFGWALGMAFQLNDDLLGIWGDEDDHRQGAVGHRRAQADPAADPRPGARARAPTGSGCWPSCHGPPPTVEDVAEARAILERAGSRGSTPASGLAPTATRRCPS